MIREKTEGWYNPAPTAGGKYHYFRRNGASLCGNRICMVYEPLEPHDDRDDRNCKSCESRLDTCRARAKASE